MAKKTFKDLSGVKFKVKGHDEERRWLYHYDERYRQDGRMWYSSCSKEEDLLHWYSKEDAKTLKEKGFKFYKYLATEYHEYPMETVFIKDTCLDRVEIDIDEFFK